MTKLSQRNSSNTSNANLNTLINPCMKPKRTRKTIPRDSPPQRSSIYRGVTRHRWTGRYEAHLWDKNCWNEAQNKKGRQVYLGAYDDEEAAARAYDLAALKYWGPDTILNFPVLRYHKELLEMEGQSREEYIGSLRRKSSGFSRGVSKYRGVARHHHNGRWEARIGRVFGNKYLYLGTYATQEEAAVAYDMAAIEYRGLNAVTNFDLSRYIKWLRPNSGDNSYPTNNMNGEANNTNQLTPSQIIIHDSGSSTTQQPPESDTPQPRPATATATSALGLLLQSSMFKEMVEMTLAEEGPATDDYYTPAAREEESSYSSEQRSSAAAITSMPEDVKTCFEANDFCGEDFFGDMNSFMQQPPTLHQFDSMLTGEDLML